MSYGHAKELARTIEDYYRRQGCETVRVWVETDKQNYDQPHYFIRSNLAFAVPT